MDSYKYRYRIVGEVPDDPNYEMSFLFSHAVRDGWVIIKTDEKLKPKEMVMDTNRESKASTWAWIWVNSCYRRGFTVKARVEMIEDDKVIASWSVTRNDVPDI